MEDLFKPFGAARTVFGLDLRSLALFRVLLGLIIIGDVIDRCSTLRVHYTEEGAMNRIDVLLHERTDYALTLHGLNGSVFFQSFMMFLHATFAFLLSIGWKTRLMQFLLFLWTISLHIHAPYVGHGGDTYCRVLLFFSLFLPLGKVWSLDSALKVRLSKDKKPRNRTFASVGNVATAAFIYQVMTMYMVSTFHKTGLEWYELNTASFWALRLKYFTTPLGNLLAQYPELLKGLTWAVLKWEFWGPLMFISPIFPQLMRLFACLGFFTLHVSFGLCLRLGFFTFITNTTIMALLPSCVWDMLEMVWFTETRRYSTVEFSSKSTFSRIIALMVPHFLLTSHTDSSVMDEKIDANAQASDTKSPARVWLQVNEPFRRQTLVNTEALLYVLRYLSPLTSIIAKPLSLLPKSLHRPLENILDSLHDFTLEQTSGSAKINGRSRASEFLNAAYKSVKLVARRLVYIYLIWMMLCILGENLNQVGYPMGFPPRSSYWMIYSTRTDQRWNMFCPRPPRKSFYYVMPGKLLDDTQVELWREGGITWETWEPTYGEIDWSEPDIPFTFYNHRWFKHMENGFNSVHDFPKQRFAQWVCREFNARYMGSTRLKSFEIWISFLEAQEDGSYEQAGRSKMWEQDCFTPGPLRICQPVIQ